MEMLMLQARRRLMETFKDMIARRRSGKELPEPDDFLQSMLRRDSYPPNDKLQDSEIMDNLMTLIIAGQTTTSAAMMWSVKFLDENQQAQDILRVSHICPSQAYLYVHLWLMGSHFLTTRSTYPVDVYILHQL